MAAPLLAMLVVAPAAAQAPARYQPTRDTLRYLSTNEQFLYFVNRGDTAGSPVTLRTRELRVARPAGDRLAMWVRLDGLDDPPFTSEDTFTLEPTGKVVAVNGAPVENLPGARVDLLPRLPAGQALVPGLTWADTLRAGGAAPYGLIFYHATRTYTVARLADTLGTTLALITGSGDLELRHGGWSDASQTQAWYQQVMGPVADTAWFDVRTGQLYAGTTVMNLAGQGGMARGLRMTAGLRSTVRLVRESSPR